MNGLKHQWNGNIRFNFFIQMNNSFSERQNTDWEERNQDSKMTLPKHQLAGPLEKKTGKEVWNMLQESKP